mmetsp:Transcript_63810/g.134395  ORF Transcript_63810/g.134395 Transcript_63810/m.134395 type:complete len:82 (+) Transcript_63810:84-329(+)
MLSLIKRKREYFPGLLVLKSSNWNKTEDRGDCKRKCVMIVKKDLPSCHGDVGFPSIDAFRSPQTYCAGPRSQVGPGSESEL